MTQTESVVAVALASWKQVIHRLDEMLSSLGDNDLQKEVAPGRNRVFYLIGHLAVVHDRLLPMLGLGDRLYPELEAAFLDNPDSHSASDVSPAEIRKVWRDVNAKLAAAFASLRPEQWLEKHGAVSLEDFAKDPLRNRLAVLLSRTNHASFHTGQIRLTR